MNKPITLLATSDYSIIGAGVYGLSTAIELAERGYQVEVFNAGPIPDPAGASSDISKIVRMEYGADTLYLDIVDSCIDQWHLWNREAEQTLYYETGFLLLCSEPMDDPSQAYEHASYSNLLARGKAPERLDSSTIAERFPLFDPEVYVDGFFHAKAGWAHANAVLQFLVRKCEALGVAIHQGIRIVEMFQTSNRITALLDQRDGRHTVNEVIACTGSFTSSLMPGFSEILIPTGHPVYHLKPTATEQMKPPAFPVFAADISNTGWYGFPMHPVSGVIKVANHGAGIRRQPPHSEDLASPSDRYDLDQFLRKSIPHLLDVPCTYKRYCYYSDTPDGHFWIDRDAQWSNVTIAAGGSGHAFKMTPILGKWIADTATYGADMVPVRFKRRSFDSSIKNQEQARPK